MHGEDVNLTCTSRPGRLIGSSGYISRIFGLKSGPDGSGQPSGFIWTKFQAKPSILDPFRTKFDVFGPDRNFGQPGFGLGLALDNPARPHDNTPSDRDGIGR